MSEGGSRLRWLFVLAALVGAVASPHLRLGAEPAPAPGKPPLTPDASQGSAAGDEPNEGRARASSPDPASDEELERLRATLRELLQEHGVSLSREEPPGEQQSKALVPLIVGIPNPTQSHMALYYDQALVALRQAAARIGYVPSHFSLPWQDSKDSQSQRTVSCRAEQPGILLFAKDPADPLLVTILVTESPVLGPLHSQLRLALTLSDEIAPSGAIPVLGPFFSGAAEAWWRAMEAQHPDGGRYIMVTGSATASGLKQSFEERGIAFGRVVPEDDYLRGELQRRVGETSDGLGRRGEIAELRELGTLYGREKEPEQPGTYFFPLNVSEVRAQSEAAGAPRADLFPSLRRTLGLKLGPERRPKPDMPAALSVLSPFVDDLALSQTFRRICDSRLRYVVISATDSADVVFLVQQSRKFCQNLVIVTIGYDSLFIHPDLAPTMAGVLNVSSFAPSVDAAALLGQSTRYPFPNWVSQGVFNAFLLLTSQIYPRAEPGLIGVACEGIECSHRVVISEIAGARYWPVSFDASTPHLGASLEADGDAMSRLPRTNSLRLFAWPVLFLALAHLWRRIQRGVPFQEVAEQWRAVWAARCVVADLTVAALVFLSTSPFWWLLSLRGPQWPPTGSEVIVAASLTTIAALLTAAVVTMVAYGLHRPIVDVARQIGFFADPRHWLGPEAKPPRTVPQFLQACASTAALAATAVLLFALVRSFGEMVQELVGLTPARDSHVTLRWFRSLEPFAMSSLMPFFYMALAMYGWCLFALLRLDRLNRFPTDLREQLGAVATVPARTLRALCAELAAPWSTTRYWGALFLVYAFCVWRFWVRLNSTLEGEGFDFGYKLAFCTILLFIVAELARFVTLSGRLLAFLRDLAAEPMIDAYDRIASKVAGSFGLQLSARAPEPDDFQISVLTARTLSNQAQPDPSSELERAAADLEAGMRNLNERPEDSNQQRLVHERLFELAGVLHPLLSRCWRQRAEAPRLDQALEVTRRDLLPLGVHGRSPTGLVLMGAVAPERYLWMRAAEDFVALRTSTFIYQVLHELRHTLIFALSASALLAASSTCYPFVPARFLTLCVWSAVVVVVGIGLVRMLALERNEVLSRLGGTRPDHIEWNASFVQQLALYVGLPLLAALLGLFPGVAEALSAHVGPLLRLLPTAN